MAKISVIGIAGNSAFMHTDHFHEKGETTVADSVYYEIGGKGINQAVAAARFGAQVSFLCAVGDDADGEKCAECCRDNGIKGFLAKKSIPTALAFILTDKHGENRVTVYRGAALDEADVYAFEREIASSDILLLQNEVPEKVNILASDIAVKNGVRVILNPAPARAVSDELSKNVWLITPNEQESAFVDLDRFENSVITLGNKGCLINGDIRVLATDDKPVDTTGAGDTFNGTLAVCIAEGKSLEAACRYGNAASGISVTRKHVLNSIPTREETERKIQG